MEHHLAGAKHRPKATRGFGSAAPDGDEKRSAIVVSPPPPAVNLQQVMLLHVNGSALCRVCELAFPSNNVASHVAGKQHQRNLDRALRTRSEWELYHSEPSAAIATAASAQHCGRP